MLLLPARSLDVSGLFYVTELSGSRREGLVRKFETLITPELRAAEPVGLR